MTTLTRSFAYTLLAFCFSGAFVAAQTDLGAVRGLVQDQQTRAIAGASVTLRNPATNFDRTVQTDNSGNYSFLGVPLTGQYVLTVKAPQFNTVERTGILLRAQTTAVFNFSWLSASGTACLMATFFAAMAVGMSPAKYVRTVGHTAKQLALAELSIANLTKDKKNSLDELTRLKSAEDARFAGIQLTGKRVVFLVDMSGSMELVDEKTEAPEKWKGVRETVVKIMRSLPDLEKFQVIVFSEKAAFLFGDKGDWIDYDPRTSSDRVFKALSAIKPKGGTNMYTAMEMTFKLRVEGLDTIYFLSDGLPNLGEGLTPAQAAKMTELEIGDVLGKYIRRKLKADWNRPLAKQPAVRINTIGFFYESPDVGAFLWALAREHDGSFVGMSKP